jgi:hypothetical protein
MDWEGLNKVSVYETADAGQNVLAVGFKSLAYVELFSICELRSL